MRILNLFAGIGGNRTKWQGHEIIAVELESKIADIYKKRFPNDTMIIGDAYEYLEKNMDNFDFIWASPPCQTHTKLNVTFQKKPRIPDMRLYGLIIYLKRFFRGNWVVENVVPYYEPLIKPNIKLDRHYFWTNIPVQSKRFPRDFAGSIKDLPLEKLCELHQIEKSLLLDLPSNHELTHDWVRQILRNCVDWRIGRYILNQTQQKSLLESIK